MEIAIENRDDKLLPGMTGRVSVLIARRPDALFLPVTAILTLEEAAYVFIIGEAGGKKVARRVNVILGEDLGDWFEIRNGLSGDEQVVMVGRELVNDGTWVEPMAFLPAKNGLQTPVTSRFVSVVQQGEGTRFRRRGAG